jgi:hypothetical protein
MCPPIDRLGETGKYAAQSAAKHASENLPSELLKHVRENDYHALNFAISDGIREMLGVPGTGRRIRKALPYLSVGQAQMIAHSGMARAMEEATFRKFLRLGIKLKRVIIGPNACQICRANYEQGPVPVAQPFRSGHLHGPFCRDRRATSTATAPLCSRCTVFYFVPNLALLASTQLCCGQHMD